jgi:hypothetical protein
MNKQSVFDSVIRRLIAQGGPSLSGPPDSCLCAYRGDAGRKCAAGMFIPDDVYRPWMEGASIFQLYQIEAVANVPEINVLGNVNLLCHMQLAHDSAARGFNPGDDWKSILLQKMHSLTIDILRDEGMQWNWGDA